MIIAQAIDTGELDVPAIRQEQRCATECRFHAGHGHSIGQMDVINSQFEISDDVVSSSGAKIENVGTSSSEEVVIALAASDDVIARVAIKRVVAGAANQQV